MKKSEEKGMKIMIKQKEIKELIQSGFDLELISFELDIPIEQLRQYKMDLERIKSNTRNITDAKEQRDKDARFKINRMRAKYKQLYFRNDNAVNFRNHPLSESDMELIRKVITTVEEKIKAMESLSKKDKKSAGEKILSELRKIEEYQLPMEQAEHIYTLMCSKELQGLSVKITNRIDYYIERQRIRSANQYARAIEAAHYETDDIEELLTLEKRITDQILKEDPVSIGAVKSKIKSKILALEQKKAIDRIRNDIPTNIMSIIQDLADGQLDIQRANKIIDEEAKRRVESKPKNRFSLTEEQERKQVLIQIRTAIREKDDIAKIQNPENTIIQMQELCGGELSQSIGVVVRKLIEQQEIETAKVFVISFLKMVKKKLKVCIVNKLDC